MYLVFRLKRPCIITIYIEFPSACAEYHSIRIRLWIREPVVECDNVRSKGYSYSESRMCSRFANKLPSVYYSTLCTCSRAFGMTCGVQQKPNSLVSKHEREAKKNTTLRAPNRTFCFSRRLFVCCLPDWLCQSAGGVAHIALPHYARRQNHPSPLANNAADRAGFLIFIKILAARAASYRISQTGSPQIPGCCLVRGHLSVWDEI
jgi:hypothetical protein